MSDNSRGVITLDVDGHHADPAALGGTTVDPHVHAQARADFSDRAHALAEMYGARESLADGTTPFSMSTVPALDRIGRSGRLVALFVSGELDATTAPELDRGLRTVLATGQVEIIVDMEAMDFIDCTGINVLMLASQRARRAGGFLVLENPSRVVMRMIQILDLDELVSRPEGSAQPLVASSIQP